MIAIWKRFAATNSLTSRHIPRNDKEYHHHDENIQTEIPAFV